MHAHRLVGARAAGREVRITLAAVGLQPVGMFYTFTLFMGETPPALSCQYYGVPYRAFSRLGGGWLVPLVVAAGVGALALVARALHLQRGFATPVDHGRELDRGLGDDAENARRRRRRARRRGRLADAAEAHAARRIRAGAALATTVQADTTLLSAKVRAAAPCGLAAAPARRVAAKARPIDQRLTRARRRRAAPAPGALRAWRLAARLGRQPRPAPRSAPNVAMTRTASSGCRARGALSCSTTRRRDPTTAQAARKWQELATPEEFGDCLLCQSRSTAALARARTHAARSPTRLALRRGRTPGA